MWSEIICDVAGSEAGNGLNFVSCIIWDGVNFDFGFLLDKVPYFLILNSGVIRYRR